MSPNLQVMSFFADVETGIYTGMALANPNATPANITMSLRNSQGAILSTRSIVLPPNGHLAKYLAEIFSPDEIASPFQGRVEVVSSQPVAGLSLRQEGGHFISLPMIP